MNTKNMGKIFFTGKSYDILFYIYIFKDKSDYVCILKIIKR